MIVQKFQNQLTERKIKIVLLLSTVFFVVGVLGSTFSLVSVFTNPEKLDDLQKLGSFILTLLITIFFAYIRFYYGKKNFHLSFRIILILFSVAALYEFLSADRDPITYIIIFLMLLSTSIVISTSKAFLYSAIIIPTIFAISVLEYLGMINNVSMDLLTLGNIFIYLTLIFVGTFVVKIGYEQIDHSYQSAFDYAKDLEELNQDLDKTVKLRTKQLVESLERQAESVHTAAVIGSITKPMLHDLATPLSSLRGAYSILEKEKMSSDISEMIQMSKAALAQIERIVEDARSLMDNKDLVVEFSPLEVISSAIYVTKNEFQKDDIKVNVKIDSSLKLAGVVAVFERMVVNIIINAAEELRQIHGKREIEIEGKDSGKFFVLSITDSGRGIKDENRERIFEPDFTLKSERNLGFGLPFVKNSIEKKFGGEITVESKKGKYSKFILKFDRKFNVLKSKRSSQS